MNKDILIIIFALIAVGAIVSAVFVFEKQNKLTKTLEEERYGRLVAEESSQKSAAKLVTLQNQVKSADEKMAKLKDILDQEKGVSADLKRQYEKLADTKSNLEEKLKATLQEQAAAAAVAEQAAQQFAQQAVVQEQAASSDVTPVVAGAQ